MLCLGPVMVPGSSTQSMYVQYSTYTCTQKSTHEHAPTKACTYARVTGRAPREGALEYARPGVALPQLLHEQRGLREGTGTSRCSI